jgi:CRISPR-associated protein Csh1
MIEALYGIGKIQKESEFLEEFIEDIGNRNKYVFKIIIDANGTNNMRYVGMDFEEFSSDKKLKYLYRGIKGNSCNYTPTAKITVIAKTWKTKIADSIEFFLRKNNEYISEGNKNFLLRVDKVLKKNAAQIQEDLIRKANERNLLSKKDGIRDGGVITLVFKMHEKEFYIGDISAFTEPFLNSKKDAYSSFYSKYGIESKSNNKQCYLCKKVKDEVWGFVDTYKFYTVDKKGMVTSGFDQKVAWKNYPVCPDCAFILERGKRYAEKELKGRFCGFNYFVLPQLVYPDKDTLKQVLKRMRSYTSFSLAASKSARIEKTEERILRDLSKESNIVNFNFVFYKISNSAFNILLKLEEIAPTRLSYLILAKDNVDHKEQRQFNIFEEIKTKKEPINFDFSFNFIKDFYTNSKIEGNFDKNFLEILNNIFIGKHIAFDFLLNRFMSKIRRDFLNDNFYNVNVLKAYKIILYLEEIGVLKRRRQEMEKKSNLYEEFFEENRIFDDDIKKALFLEGVLADKLLSIQYQERKAKPFYSRLNGLKIDERVSRRLLPEMINKLEEYDKNYYRDIEEAIGLYFLEGDFTKYSIDEMSFYFTLGMVLSKHFNNKEARNE